ncbi:MAG: hypothetical protein ACREQ7_07410 [Candidatus Binatia bacterium]
MTFNEGRRLSLDQVRALERAFRHLYFDGFLGGEIRLRCTIRSCDGSTVAHYGAGVIRLCARFFRVSAFTAASTLIHELLHWYANLGHSYPPNPVPPIQAADYYQRYVERVYEEQLKCPHPPSPPPGIKINP